MNFKVVKLDKKIEVIFITITIFVGALLSWLEVLNVYSSDCSEPFQPILFGFKFGLFLLSRFYLMSVWNIELLIKYPYDSTLGSPQTTSGSTPGR
jgi:hypothetical protein